MECTMYHVKYKNDTLVLTKTDQTVKYMFDATKTKMLELKQAIKNNDVDALPRLAKFKRKYNTRVPLWILAD